MLYLEDLKRNLENKFLNVTPQYFEECIANLFEDDGYNVILTPYTSDGGIDIIVSKPNLKIGVQVKRYGDSTVRAGAVGEVLMGRGNYGCNQFRIITSSNFTDDCQKYAKNNKVDLWTWDKLYREFKRVYFLNKDISEFIEYEKKKIVEYQKKYRDDEILFSVNEIKKDQAGNVVISIDMYNLTESEYKIKMELPYVVSTFDKRLEAQKRYKGFKQGCINPNGKHSVEFVWMKNTLSTVRVIKYIFVRYLVEGKDRSAQKEVFVLPSVFTRYSCKADNEQKALFNLS